MVARACARAGRSINREPARRSRGQKRHDMHEDLTQRMSKALDRIGGALAVLELPEEVKQIVTGCEDYESRVQMLELIADTMRGGESD